MDDQPTVTPEAPAEDGGASPSAAPVVGADPGPAATPANREPSPRRRTLTRFALAFTFGLVAVLAIAAGALAAYESSTAGRIVRGVHVGSVDLSGLSPSEAASRLRDAYKGLADGTLVLAAGDQQRSIGYDDLGRRIDVDALVAAAMDVGRGGPAIERIAANVRTLIGGVELAPTATIERAALRYEIAALAAATAVAPVDAAVTATDAGFEVTPGSSGRAADIEAGMRDAEAVLVDPAASTSTRVEIALRVIEPVVTTDEATAARDAADRIARDITLVAGSETWQIPGSTVRSWISFTTTGDGGYVAVVAREGLEAGLAALAPDVAVEPVDASFLIGSGDTVVGVSEGKNGRAIDVAATVADLEALVHQRASGQNVASARMSLEVIEPELTTEEATATAPLMEPISEWTTYFPVGIKNGNGANIWIPANDIDGYVVKPGAWFDFWQAIGPVTRERGYKDGGAIINGKTEPQGALAGGICSCSTTLFNAALRAGLEMGARRNHYYYIDRYPLGLDATVFQSSSGSIQTMSFRNDTANPILIRGTGWHVGSKGYVKFVLWSVPTGRSVELTTPIVENVKPATDTVVYTSELAPGVKERVEYPVDGKDVWVTRIVRDAQGTVIHEETYYSHYSRITGITRVGTGASPSPSSTPAPSASPG